MKTGFSFRTNWWSFGLAIQHKHTYCSNKTSAGIDRYANHQVRIQLLFWQIWVGWNNQDFVDEKGEGQ